jgi:integrase
VKQLANMSGRVRDPQHRAGGIGGVQDVDQFTDARRVDVGESCEIEHDSSFATVQERTDPIPQVSADRGPADRRRLPGRAPVEGVLQGHEAPADHAGAMAAYQNARTESGHAPKTINGELSVIRQVLKRAKLWYRFDDEYTTLRNRKAPVGRALTPEEQERLFQVARTKPAWLYAYVAATLAFYCGRRACEIKGLRWEDIDLSNRLLHVDQRHRRPGDRPH